jgi:hypothetical protein
VIKEHAPGALKEGEIKAHFGRKVAIVSIAISHAIVHADLNRMREIPSSQCD